MIKHLVTNGCSFTIAPEYDWPRAIGERLGFPHTHNLAKSGAGNYYIADSTIQWLSAQQYNPSETLVIIMWSGITRIDQLISKEYFDMIKYAHKYEINNQYYLFSGGELGTWSTDSFIRPLFSNIYKTLNFQTLAHNTLSNMLRTKNYLESRRYNYQFLSYVNYWKDTKDYVSDMDYSLAYYASTNPLYYEVCLSNWIFSDDNQKCLYEFSKERKLLEADNFHPNKQAHYQFADEVIIPNIKRYFQ